MVYHIELFNKKLNYIMVVTVEYLGGWCSVSRGERLLYYIMDNDNMDDNIPITWTIT